MSQRVLLLLQFLFFCLLSYSQTQEFGFVEYTDSVSKIGAVYRTRTNEISSLNDSGTIGVLRSREGKIEAKYENSYFMTEGVKHCLKMAMDCWESKIKIVNPIKFYVCISENLPDEIAIQTKVGYSLKSRFNSVPDNLYYQDKENICPKDTILINAMVDWNSSWPYDDTYLGSDKLANGFLRHIAHILGFGTSLVYRSSGELGFAVNRSPSPFDRLLYNGQKNLADLKLAKNQELLDFFAAPLCLHSKEFNYKVYSPGKFVLDKSGDYFTLGYDNIMEFSITNSNEQLDINEETLNVIRFIGWETCAHEKKIVSSGTDVLGYGSYFKNHSFTLLGGNDSSSWECQSYNLTSGNYETLCSGVGKKFIPSLTVKNNSVDDFSCLNYRVCCVSGNKTYFYPLSLDMHPLIEDIKISNVSIKDNFCEYDLLISQKGATSGSVLVSDDSGATKEYKYMNGSVVHVKILPTGYQNYVDVTLSNDYGTASKFMVFNPYSSIPQMKKNKLHIQVQQGEKISLSKLIFRDQDELIASLPSLNSNVNIDSVRWYLDVNNYNGRTVQHNMISTDLELKTRVTPDLFNCNFYKTDGCPVYDRSFYYRDKPMGNPDDCFVSCTLYGTIGTEHIKLLFDSERVKFDVLPMAPKLEICEAKEIQDEYGDNIEVSIKVSNDNFKGCIIYGYSTYMNPLAPIDNLYVDTVYEGAKEFFHTLYFADWNNLIFAESFNDYGGFVSDWLKPVPTAIKSATMDDFLLKQENSKLEGNSKSTFTIRIYSIDGKKRFARDGIKYFSVDLPRGMYILKIINKNSILLTKKYIVK